MDPILEPLPNQHRTVSVAFMVLTKWYAAHARVRRLWALRDSVGMRVIVTLQPTHDGDDIYPAWLAKAHEWAHELESLMEGPVQFEVMDEEVMDEPLHREFGAGVLVADLFWRDSSVLPDDPPDVKSRNP
jgi:hypothetical protein